MAASRVAMVFKLNPKGFDLRRGVSLVVVMLVPLIVLAALDELKYFVSVAFRAFFVGLCDPGGRYKDRVPRMAVVGVLGALLTALGFRVGDAAWGWVTLVAFTITLLCSLAVTYGEHRFTAALLLNIWFLIALSCRAPTGWTTCTPRRGRRRWHGWSGRRSSSFTCWWCGCSAGGVRARRPARS